jgi:hypothetical protein
MRLTLAVNTQVKKWRTQLGRMVQKDVFFRSPRNLIAEGRASSFLIPRRQNYPQKMRIEHADAADTSREHTSQKMAHTARPHGTERRFFRSPRNLTAQGRVSLFLTIDHALSAQKMHIEHADAADTSREHTSKKMAQTARAHGTERRFFSESKKSHCTGSCELVFDNLSRALGSKDAH